MADGDSGSDSDSDPGFSLRRVLPSLVRREIGTLEPKRFAHRVKASEDFVHSVGFHGRLNGHKGCVNSVSFNEDGSIILSGSDDKMVILWNWEKATTMLSFHSGHSYNILNAQFMPYCNDRSIITCACDGEVRHFQLFEGKGATRRLLLKSEHPVHKMATEPGNPHIFYSCGEDGSVVHFDLRTKLATVLFRCSPFHKHAAESTIRLYSIALDPRSPNHLTVAGSDEFARIYDIRKCNLDGAASFGEPTDYFCPPDLRRNDQTQYEITGLAFSQSSELLISYSYNDIYLFSKHQGLLSNNLLYSSASSSEETCSPKIFSGHQNRETTKGVSFLGPSCEYVASGSDCGYIYIWRKESGCVIRAMKADSCIVNCVEQNPSATVFASCGIDNDVKIWMPGGRASLPQWNQRALSESESYNSMDDAYMFDVGDDMFDTIIEYGSSSDSDDGFSSDGGYDVDENKGSEISGSPCG